MAVNISFMKKGTIRKILTGILMILSIAKADAQISETICLKPPDSTQYCFRIWKPSNKLSKDKLVILLPPYGANHDHYADEKIVRLLPSRDIYLAIVDATPRWTGYMDEDYQSMKCLDTIIHFIVKKFGITSTSVILGGYSSGGVGAVRYAEYLAKGRGTFGIKPVAVFSVDAPLDLERWYRGNELVIQRGEKLDQESYRGAIQMNEMLKAVLGCTPKENRGRYVEISAYSAFEPGGGNAKFLKDIPVRLYVEKDIDTWVKYYNLDFYSLNLIDQAAMVNQLKALGNAEAELIATTGKGFKNYHGNFLRIPHAWSIVDESELCEWMLMKFDGHGR
jgi:hypothetical protein